MRGNAPPKKGFLRAHDDGTLKVSHEFGPIGLAVLDISGKHVGLSTREGKMYIAQYRSFFMSAALNSNKVRNVTQMPPPFMGKAKAAGPNKKSKSQCPKHQKDKAMKHKQANNMGNPQPPSEMKHAILRHL